jgi:beta-phosphoglucomutase-like phosphatase (HAD superfamily)
MTECVAVHAVLFDMDGVVADTEEAVTVYWQDLAVAHGIKLSPDDFHRHVYGLPASHTFDVLFVRLNERERADALALTYAREAAGPYREMLAKPHAPDTLKWLSLTKLSEGGITESRY